MPELDQILYTVIIYVIYAVVGLLMFMVFIIVSVNKIPVIGWFVPDIFDTPESSTTLYNYKFTQVMEHPYSAAIALAGLGIDDRKFMEHAAESAYYGSLALSNSVILGKEGGPLDLFMRSYNMPFKAELKGVFSVSKDGRKVNIGVNVPVMYKDRKWDILVGLHG